MNKRGQSTIEYALIAILVIIGIVYMGPYALRSINAHFKLWDVGVQDSFEETLNQAPASVVPNISSNCQCSTVNEDCGSSEAGSSCPTGYRAYTHTCNLVGCDYDNTPSGCNPDPTCCSEWTALGCGSYPLPASYAASGTAPPSGSPPAPDSCYYGQKIYAQQCGSNNAVKCVDDASCLLPACTGTVSTIGGAQNATACPGTMTGLDQNYPYTYVNSSGACSTTKCQYYCNSGQANISQTGCLCPEGEDLEKMPDGNTYCLYPTPPAYDFYGTILKLYPILLPAYQIPGQQCALPRNICTNAYSDTTTPPLGNYCTAAQNQTPLDPSTNPLDTPVTADTTNGMNDIEGPFQMYNIVTQTTDWFVCYEGNGGDSGSNFTNAYTVFDKSPNPRWDNTANPTQSHFVVQRGQGKNTSGFPYICACIATYGPVQACIDPDHQRDRYGDAMAERYPYPAGTQCPPGSGIQTTY